MLSLSTAQCWKCPDVISPQSIARGKGDRYIVSLGKALAHRRKPTYIRLMPEMNGYWNRYSAFESSGEPRDKAHSTKNFKKAWRRFVLITPRRRAQGDRQASFRSSGCRGSASGPTEEAAAAEGRLRLGPAVDRLAGRQGQPPKDYFPGWDYVDWVGADVYGKYPNIAGVDALYKKYSKRPFMIGEWSSWDVDRPKFVKDLFGWIEKHGRASMAVYYQGFGEGADNPYELSDYPKSTRSLRHILNVEEVPPVRSRERAQGSPGRQGTLSAHAE